MRMTRETRTVTCGAADHASVAADACDMVTDRGALGSFSGKIVEERRGFRYFGVIPQRADTRRSPWVIPMIVDAHLPVWRAIPAYPEPAVTTISPVSDVPVELLREYMAEHGVDRAVLVQPMYP